MIRIGSLCTGYGGLDMAVERVLGGRMVWYSEFEKHPSTLLAARFPGITNLGDLTKIDWNAVPEIDVLTGGYPCQPFSVAGKRLGEKDPRHLWPSIREAIRILRPRLTLLENVAGHRRNGFSRVLGDCAEDGLDVRWVSVRASDVGAPHQRERLFFVVSYPDSSGWQTAGRQSEESRSSSDGCVATVTDPSRADEREYTGEPPSQEAGTRAGNGSEDHRGARPAEDGWEATTDSERFGRCGLSEPERGYGDEDPSRITERGEAVTDAGSVGFERGGPTSLEAEGPQQAAIVLCPVVWGEYEPAIRRWERTLGRSAPAPTEPNKNGKPRLTAEFDEWMMGLPEGWVTDIDIPYGAKIKLCGNGVVPQQAELALRLLLDMERGSDAALQD